MQIHKLHKNLHCEKLSVILQAQFKHIFWIERFYENQSTLFSIHFDCISNMPLNNKPVKWIEQILEWILNPFKWYDFTSSCFVVAQGGNISSNNKQRKVNLHANQMLLSIPHKSTISVNLPRKLSIGLCIKKKAECLSACFKRERRSVALVSSFCFSYYLVRVILH